MKHTARMNLFHEITTQSCAGTYHIYLITKILIEIDIQKVSIYTNLIQRISLDNKKNFFFWIEVCVWNSHFFQRGPRTFVCEKIFEITDRWKTRFCAPIQKRSCFFGFTQNIGKIRPRSFLLFVPVVLRYNIITIK